jgi:D-beta-D-heptose 7-phosphate kinase/D-beta-D-heptose 1-phosphate adenosyltransferase
MARLDRRRLESLIGRFPGVHLLVIGDVLLDEYLFGEVDRVSAEAPVPVVHVGHEASTLGGAGNVVRNVVALGASCSMASVIGADASGRRIAALMRGLGVDADGLVEVEGRTTGHKTRVVARSRQVVRFSQQVVRIDRETTEHPPPGATRRLIRYIEDVLPEVDGVVLEDYGKGLFTKGLLTSVMRRCREADVPVAVDPKTSLTLHKGIDLLKPNLPETEDLSGVTVRDRADLDRAAAKLRRRIGGGRLVVTRGPDGMSLFEGDGPGIDVHTVAREVFDVQGAGDTTIAALVLALRAGGSLLEAAVIANAAAGVAVGKSGTATASPAEVRRLLPAAIRAAQEAS